MPLYAPPTTASGGDLVKIEEIVLAAPALSFDFLNIPATYQSLVIHGVARASVAAADRQTWVRFNNDSGTNYDHVYMHSNGTALSTGEAGGPIANGCRGTEVAAANAPANSYSTFEIVIPFYAQTFGHKSALTRGGSRETAIQNGNQFMQAKSTWLSTAAITRVTIHMDAAANFIANSRATLYGLK